MTNFKYVLLLWLTAALLVACGGAPEPDNPDKKPVITSSSKISVTEGKYKNIHKIEVTNTDGESLDYDIIGGEDERRFEINDAGEISFKRQIPASVPQVPDFEKPADADKDNIYRLIVRVTDLNSNSSTQDIVITVTDASKPQGTLVFPPEGTSFLSSIEGVQFRGGIYDAEDNELLESDLQITLEVNAQTVDVDGSTWRQPLDLADGENVKVEIQGLNGFRSLNTFDVKANLNFSIASAVAVDNTNNRLVVYDRTLLALYSIDKATQEVKLLSGQGRGSGAPLHLGTDIALTEDGQTLFMSRTLGEDADFGVYKVDLLTGDREGFGDKELSPEVALPSFDSIEIDEKQNRLLFVQKANASILQLDLNTRKYSEIYQLNKDDPERVYNFSFQFSQGHFSYNAGTEMLYIEARRTPLAQASGSSTVIEEIDLKNNSSRSVLVSGEYPGSSNNLNQSIDVSVVGSNRILFRVDPKGVNSLFELEISTGETKLLATDLSETFPVAKYSNNNIIYTVSIAQSEIMSLDLASESLATNLFYDTQDDSVTELRIRNHLKLYQGKTAVYFFDRIEGSLLSYSITGRRYNEAFSIPDLSDKLEIGLNKRVSPIPLKNNKHILVGEHVEQIASSAGTVGKLSSSVYLSSPVTDGFGAPTGDKKLEEVVAKGGANDNVTEIIQLLAADEQNSLLYYQVTSDTWNNSNTVEPENSVISFYRVSFDPIKKPEKIDLAESGVFDFSRKAQYFIETNLVSGNAEQLSLYAISLEDGSKTLVSSINQRGEGPSLFDAREFDVDTKSNSIYLLGAGAPSPIMRIDLATGDRQIICDNPGVQGPELNEMRHMSIDSENSRMFLALSRFWGPALFVLDLQTCARVKVRFDK